MKFIPLTNSRFSTIVDDEDYGKVKELKTKWIVVHQSTGKPAHIRSSTRVNGRYVLLHRFIMGCVKPNGMFVDHRFGNIFDNRKSFQLRWSTRSQNQATGKLNGKIFRRPHRQGIYERANHPNE